jgi:hypothetical protein
MEEIKRDFKGIWITKEIWLDTELSWIEKFVLAEINSLDGEEGCFASNDYFSKFFKLSKTRISQIINSLIQKKYISAEYIKKGNEIVKRVLHTLYNYDKEEDTKKNRKNTSIILNKKLKFPDIKMRKYWIQLREVLIKYNKDFEKIEDEIFSLEKFIKECNNDYSDTNMETKINSKISFINKKMTEQNNPFDL